MAGRTWSVRRRWAPRGPASLVARFRQWAKFAWGPKPKAAAPSAPATPRPRKERGGCLDAGMDFVGEGCAELVLEAPLILLAVATVLIAIFIVLPLVLAVLDVVVALILAGAGIVGRVLFRRPWTIEATSSDGTRLSWQVVGWRASSTRRAEIAEALDAGVVPPSDPA